MAETKDPIAHLASLPLKPNSITMLNGRRYHQRYRFEANQYFRIPANLWDEVKDDLSDNEIIRNGHSYSMLSLVKWYLRVHFQYQLRRILDLERYYAGDNDIHYWKSNKVRRADNRIADNYPRYCTNFEAGFLTGKPLKYSYSDNENNDDDGTDLLNEIKDFNNSSDTKSHDEQMNKDMLNTGRAYELEYVKPNTTNPAVTRIDPNQCFIIWSTDVDPQELCGVRYTFNRIENNYDYQVEIYTDDKIYTFDAGSDILGNAWNLIDTQSSPFGEVPITEFVLNKERIGLWEPELDDIDALDKAMSEMADSQEDFSNATLVVSGAVKRPSNLVPLTDSKNRQWYYQQGHYQDYGHLTLNRTTNGKVNRMAFRKRTMDTNSNVLWLMPSTDNSGNVKSQPTIKYLTKQLDVNEWQAYINELKSRIEQFTGVPNMNADSSSNNQTDYETAMKFIHAIENSSNIESNFRHGIIRRLHLLVNYLNRLPGHFTSNDNLNNPDDVTVHFDFNVPLDIQSTIQEIRALIQTGDFSKQTIQEMGAKFTGVSQDEEQKRLDSQNSAQQSSNADQVNSAFQNELNVAGMGSSNAVNNAISNSNIDNHSSNADNHALSNEVKQQSNQPSSNGNDPSQTSSNYASKINSSSDLTNNSFNNSYSDSNGSATSEIMNPNMGFDQNGSMVSLNDSQADNMALASIILDSLYASGGGFPSGFDNAMNSVVDRIASSSMSTADIQSASVDNSLMSSLTADSLSKAGSTNSSSSSSD